MTSYIFVDIDECATQTDECPDNSRCINTPGSYRCECWSGFTKIGEICEGKIWMNYLTMILTNYSRCWSKFVDKELVLMNGKFRCKKKTG